MKTGEVTLDSRWKRWLTVHVPWLADGETVTSITSSVAAVSDGATDVEAPECTVYDTEYSDGMILFLVGGGVDATSYNVSLDYLTSRQQRGYDTIVVNIDNGGT